MKNNKRYLLQVHGAVLLFGLSGLFGKLDQPAMVITLGRVVFSALFLLVLLNLRHIPYRVSGRQLAALAGLGAVLAFHWCSFYQAIQAFHRGHRAADLFFFSHLCHVFRAAVFSAGPSGGRMP